MATQRSDEMIDELIINFPEEYEKNLKEQDK